MAEIGNIGRFRKLTVRLALSPLQWGERPGNLRFTLYMHTEKLPLGSISVGGLSAYRLQQRVRADGECTARVLCGNSSERFVLRELMIDGVWQDWRTALEETAASKAQAQRLLIGEMNALGEIQEALPIVNAQASIRSLPVNLQRSRVAAAITHL
jgi:hypothetical protein